MKVRSLLCRVHGGLKTHKRLEVNKDENTQKKRDRFVDLRK